MNNTWRVAVLVALLLIGGAVVNGWEYLGEVPVPRRVLDDFPREVGSWRQVSGDQRFDSATLSILGASDYLMRDYQNAGSVANLYIGYYASQKEGATYHSPLNCLPGSGWTLNDPGSVTISAQGREPFVANRYVIENGGRKEMMVYWYQGRGRAVASEYWGKVYTVIDSVRLRRSDAAMVRVMVPVTTSEAAALDSATGLAAYVSTVLPEFVPD
ncbi:MAG TPA: EpsI family protein [Pyrinomonadaceae bacterium]|nr:EpsI family protein [Pyrinomonadaceae bacterium]